MAVLGVGAALFGAGTFFAGVADAVVGIAVSMGISYAAQEMQGKPPAPEAARFSVQGTLQAGGEVPRSFILGKYSTAGSLTYANTWGTSDDGKSPNAYLTQVITLSDIPVKGLLGVLVNGETCTIDTGTVTDKGHPVLEYRKDGKDHLWIKFYDGTQTVADNFLVTKVGSAARPYAATRVGVGLAYAIATALVAEELWTGYPTFKFVIDGIKLYDPTRDTTNEGDGAQRFADTATWGGDGDYLPMVQTYNLLRGIRYGDQWMCGLQTSGPATVPAFNWNAQIAKCRAPIEGPDGDEPTYISGLQVNVNVPADQIATTLMTACQGKLSEVGGSYKAHCGAPDSPSFYITDNDWISSEPQTAVPFKRQAESINGITGTYPDPDQGWNTAPAPALYSPADEATDGNRRLLASPAFDAVPRASQVQRLMKSALEAARRERTHVGVMPPRYWRAEPGDVIAWKSVREGYGDPDDPTDVGKLFEFTMTVPKPNFCNSVGICEVDPSDFGWNHNTDFRPSTTGPLTFVRPAPQGVSDWNVEGQAVTDADGFKRRAVARLTWDNQIPGVVGIRWRIRRKDDGSAVTVGSITVPGVSSIDIDQNILPLTDYEMSTQYVPSAPRDMLWSEWRTFTTPDARLGLVDFQATINEKWTTAAAIVASSIKAVAQQLDEMLTLSQLQDWVQRETVQSNLVATDGRLTGAIKETRDIAIGLNEVFSQWKIEVEGRLDDPATGLAATATATQSLTTLVNSPTEGLPAKASAAAVAALQSQVNDPSNGLAVTAAATSSLNTQVNQAGTGIAAKLDTVTTAVGGHSSSISQLMSSVDGTHVTGAWLMSVAGAPPGGIILDGFVSGGVTTYNVMINGNVILPGTVTAGAMNVGTLFSISNHFGDATVDGKFTATNGVMIQSWSEGWLEIWG